METTPTRLTTEAICLIAGDGGEPGIHVADARWLDETRCIFPATKGQDMRCADLSLDGGTLAVGTRQGEILKIQERGELYASKDRMQGD